MVDLPVRKASQPSSSCRKSLICKKRGRQVARTPLQISDRLEASAERQRNLVSRQAMLIVGVAVFAADVGLAADRQLAACAETIAVEILGKAIEAVIGLEPGVGVAGLEIEVGRGADRKADAAAGIEVAACLYRSSAGAFLLGRLRGFDVGAE